MSCKPHALGSFVPIGRYCPSLLSQYQPCSSSPSASFPKEYAVVLPARQAYSHSASVGKR